MDGWHWKDTPSCRLQRQLSKNKQKEGPPQGESHLLENHDNQPFSIVQDAGFTKLGEYLEPHFAMSSHKYFTDVYLPELYSVIYSHIKKLN